MGETVSIGSHYSFYREHSEIVRITLILLMLVSGWFTIRQLRKHRLFGINILGLSISK